MRTVERTEEHLAWLALNRLPQIAGGRCLQLVQHFGSATAVLKASVPAWGEIIGKAAAQGARAEPVAWDWAEAQWKMLEQRGGHLLSLADPDYPALLLETASPPAVLHVLGEIPEDISCLSIVGTREPTSYGREVARQLARTLGRTRVSAWSVEWPRASTRPPTRALWRQGERPLRCWAAGWM